MSTTSTTSTPTRATASQRPPWRLSASWRKAILTTHLVSGLGWLGIDVVLGILSFTGLTSDDPATVAVCYQAIALFAVPALLTAGLVCLGSGLLLGLGSKYGLIRYWWVATKLALNLVLTSLVLVALKPAAGEAAELSRQAAAGLVADGLDRAQLNLIFPPVVSISALIFASVLAVYKPWGRLRGRTAR